MYDWIYHYLKITYSAAFGILECLDAVDQIISNDEQDNWTIDTFFTFYDNGSLIIKGQNKHQQAFTLSHDNTWRAKRKHKCDYKQWRSILEHTLKVCHGSGRDDTEIVKEVVIHSTNI